MSLFPNAIFGFVPISSYLAVLKVLWGPGSSISHKLALNPKGKLISLSSSIEFSTISGDTQAPIKPSQFSFLYFLTTSVIDSPEGSTQFFFKWTPARIGFLSLAATFDAISNSLPLDKTSK